ncbi:MAG TPA: two-component regulator propeller domain-containing protein [Puia sp.]|jgi:signal transduction histidine kinase/ligand-binding sensor domain-containing protein
MPKLILFCALLLLTELLPYSSPGQDREFYPFRKYSQADGLSSYNITKILQDINGFVWISTQDGLNCFDGKTFIVFNKQKDPRHQLAGNTIMDMTEDRKRGVIWLVTSYGGLQAININTRSVQPLDDQERKALVFSNKWLHSVAIAGDILWIGTYAGLYGYDLASRHAVTPSLIPAAFGKPDSLRVGRLLADSSGHCWAFCDGQGILVLDGNTGRLTTAIPAGLLNIYQSKKELLFWNACPADGGGILACTNWGLRRLDTIAGGSLRITQDGLPKTIVQNEVFSCTIDTGRNIWVSDAHHLYRLSKGGHFTTISERDYGNDAWQTAIYALHADAGNRLWVGSEEGLSYFTPVTPAFEKFYRSHTGNARIQHAFSICPYNDSLVYCGAANGLYEVNTTTDEIRQLSTASSGYLTDQLNRDQLIVSNSKGLFILTRSRLSGDPPFSGLSGDAAAARPPGGSPAPQLVPARQLYPELQPLENDLLCAMVRYNDSIVLLASELRKGLYIWNTRTKKITLRNGSNGLILDDGLINGLYRDRDGRIWILSVNSVSLYDPASFVKDSLPGSKDPLSRSKDPLSGSFTWFPLRVPGTGASCNILFDMCETSGSYWVAAYGMGLIELDKKMKVIRILSDKDGLCNNGVYKVFSSGDSLILVTSNDGLSVLNTRKNTIKNYFEPDGLHSNAFEQFCGYSKGDIIYTGGVNGFTRIHPRYFSSNLTPPRLYITSVRMTTASHSLDTAGLGLTHLDIPSNVYQTTVFFSGIDLSNPERTTYFYKIKELNDSWTSLGSQNFLHLIGLNPSRYTLQIRAINEDGIGNTVPVTLSLRFLPKWYQTLGFRLAVIALTSLLLFALYRYRISQFKRQQQIRRDIANDLHDDLGSTLNTVKVLTHLAKRSPRYEEHLDKIEESLTAASSGLRDMIWVLDDSADTFQGLLDRIRRAVLPVITANEIQLDSCIEGDIGDTGISKAEKRNLLLIAKEAVNNSIKYACCKNIRICLRLNGNKPGLHISDDGKGFGILFPPAAPGEEKGEGNGLKNIRHRAEQINYYAAISSAPGNGTVIAIVKK